MERTFKITVDSREYHVTVEEITESGSMVLPDAGSMQIPKTTSTAAPPPSAPTSSPQLAAANAGDEVSPLAGTIASVDVSVGQQVSEGDKIASVEAMKMCTSVVAHHTGTVTRVDIKSGDAVEAGQVLLNIAQAD
jgi:glutaconyl-CoA/methylmalonyl-CoA decarboxylase subunit gamma